MTHDYTSIKHNGEYWIRLIDHIELTTREVQKAQKEERALLRYAIERVAQKHGGAVEVILQGVIGGIDRINQAELDQNTSNK